VRETDGATGRRGDAAAPGTRPVAVSPGPPVRFCAAREALLAFLVLAAGGCGYSLVGKTSNLPPSIKVIRFETLANQTQRVGVEQRLSHEIVKELTSRGRFSVQARADGANAELSGAVTGFDLYAIAFNSQGVATEYQIRISAKVTLKTLPDDKVLWDNPGYTFRDNYTFSTTAANYVDRENEVIDKVSERFAASLVSTILEGF
jgi:outer membrane lipopolysaccharide assembly protein LptE/RlpB